MNLKKRFLKFLPLVAFILIIGLIIPLWVLYIPIMRREPIPGERKAIIISSANDFHKSEGEDDFNNGEEANFSAEMSNWTWNNQTNGYGGVDRTYPGRDGLPGALQLIAQNTGYVYMEFVYNWTRFYTLYEYASYNLSAWINISTYTGIPVTIMPPGEGVRVGLRWLNSTNDIVRTDWSIGIYDTLGQWEFISVISICDNSTDNEITQLQLVLAVEGMMNSGEQVLFDDVMIERWISVNVTNPINPIPPPGKINSDGFAAQALQVYWILKNHGYTDDNIFLMLYYKDDIDGEILIEGSTNALDGAIIDVANNSVNATRFKRELNATVPGSFASNITKNDQLIIYMVDHGSNKKLSDGNATFHFEADDSYITEFEFFNLAKEINCKRMMINMDICFSGNFLMQNSIDWYNLPKAILITSTTNIFSWYWRDTNNPDGFAGSWFFHQFWVYLDQNYTIEAAFNSAKTWIPSGQVLSINDIQAPLIQDNLDIKASWSFNNTPQL
ncbi:MAG: C13 family peptidase [Promethearchaeota archaeon]